MNAPENVIRNALERYTNWAERHRYGGRAWDYALAQRALEALDALVEARQMELMGGNDEHLRSAPGQR